MRQVEQDFGPACYMRITSESNTPHPILFLRLLLLKSIARTRTCQILLFRPSRVMVETDEEIQYDAIARSAADGMTRIAEDLLTSGTLRQAQVHL